MPKLLGSAKRCALALLLLLSSDSQGSAALAAGGCEQVMMEVLADSCEEAAAADAGCVGGLGISTGAAADAAPAASSAQLALEVLAALAATHGSILDGVHAHSGARALFCTCARRL